MESADLFGSDASDLYGIISIVIMQVEMKKICFIIFNDQSFSSSFLLQSFLSTGVSEKIDR